MRNPGAFKSLSRTTKWFRRRLLTFIVSLFLTSCLIIPIKFGRFLVWLPSSISFSLCKLLLPLPLFSRFISFIHHGQMDEVGLRPQSEILRVMKHWQLCLGWGGKVCNKRLSKLQFANFVIYRSRNKEECYNSIVGFSSYFVDARSHSLQICSVSFFTADMIFLFHLVESEKVYSKDKCWLP